MGVLGKDLFDLDRPRTHVKVQFGAEGYWIEHREAQIPYGATLTEILNYDVQPYRQCLAEFETVFRAGERDAVTEQFRRIGQSFSALPFYRLFLLEGTPEDSVFVTGIGNTALDRLLRHDVSVLDKYYFAAEDIIVIQNRYVWFLQEMVAGNVPEKKKGQRKKPLAEQIYDHAIEAFVSGVSLGLCIEPDAPPVNVQYAIIDKGDGTHELVEKMYFDRLLDFVYVEFMRGLQRGFVPKQCGNCGRWFLQQPGSTYNYCDGPAPGAEGKICREIGATTSFQDKVRNNDVWKVHQRAYKKYFARTKSGAMSKPAFEQWAREAEQIRDKALKRYEKARTAEERKAIADEVAKKLNQM